MNQQTTPHGQSGTDYSDHLVFAPPTRFCHQCIARNGFWKKLSIHIHATQVKYFGLDVAEKRWKICLKCDSWDVNYNLHHYGNKNIFNCMLKKETPQKLLMVPLLIEVSLRDI